MKSVINTLFSFRIKLILLISYVELVLNNSQQRINSNLFFQTNLIKDNIRTLPPDTIPDVVETYSDQTDYFSKFLDESINMSFQDIKVINGMTTLINSSHMIVSYVLDKKLKLNSYLIGENGVSYISSFTSSNDAYNFDTSNSGLYATSASVAYLSNSQFLLFYSNSFDTDKYNVYAEFIEYDSGTDTFSSSSSYSAYDGNNLASVEDISNISDFSTDVNYYYTNVIKTTPTSSTDLVVLSLSIYE